jgi:hypothetical protein
MSWSFEIFNGDLTLTSRQTGMGIVTGNRKTLQDLRVALAESMGNDPMHPDFGSLLDGGKLSTGRVIPSMIGGNYLSAFQIEEEIRRVIQNFIERQSARIKRDISAFGRTSIPDSEIIDKIGYINSRSFGHKLVVQVGLIMKDTATITITQPVG